MIRVVELIRRIVRRELARLRGPRLAVVTAVFPHAAKDDEYNYEVSVQLKHEALQLRRIPLAIPYVGVAALPRVGDLVLVQFVDGDINQPVVTGCLYHADVRPPLHQEDDVVFEHRVPDGTLNHLRFGPDGSIFLQRDVKNPADNSEASASIAFDSSGDIELVRTGEQSASVKLTDGEVTIDCDKMTVNCDTLTVNGDLIVDSGEQSTTISGNRITGA